uniref:RAB5 interacting factor n=1 Tax=Gasterosteus aculeatus aculeatus TaxID=481459 RepID=G3N8S7_GASAC
MSVTLSRTPLQLPRIGPREMERFPSPHFSSCFLLYLRDEFWDVIYGLRQFFAVILGVIWGVAPFCVINAGVLYVYFSSFQQIDEEEYGGTWELTKEGFMTSFALFLVRMLLNETRGVDNLLHSAAL